MHVADIYGDHNIMVFVYNRIIGHTTIECPAFKVGGTDSESLVKQVSPCNYTTSIPIGQRGWLKVTSIPI